MKPLLQNKLAQIFVGKYVLQLLADVFLVDGDRLFPGRVSCPRSCVGMLYYTLNWSFAGLGFGVRLKAGDFIGKEALVAAKAKPNRPVRIGLELQGKRIAREGAIILDGENKVGEVTSGTFSPTFQKSIAIGYVLEANCEPGTELTIDIRSKHHQAKVVELPFYKRETS